MSAHTREALHVTCPTCGAKPFEFCTAVRPTSVEDPTRTHAARSHYRNLTVQFSTLAELLTAVESLKQRAHERGIPVALINLTDRFELELLPDRTLAVRVATHIKKGVSK